MSGLILSFVVAGVAVVYYAVVAFPKQLANEGRGALPRRFVASALFAMVNLFMFCVLVVLVHVGLNVPTLVAAVAQSDAAAMADQFERLRTDVPLTIDTVVTGAAALFGLFGLQSWRAVEAGVLRQFHSISLIPADEKGLASKLERGAFSGEGSGAAEKLVAIERKASPDRPEPRQGVSLGDKHAKLAALAGLWSGDPGWTASLPREEAPDLGAVFAFLDRKARLVENVRSHVTRIETGDTDPETLARLVEQLRPGAAPSPDLLEELSEALRGGRGGRDQAAVDATLSELLRPLVAYLHEEYDEKLDALVAATARAVMMAGDRANRRLKELEAIGFEGLGRLPVLSLHKALLFAMIVMIGILLTFWGVTALRGALASVGEAETDGGNLRRGRFIALMTVNLTVATIIGVMVGGLRSLAMREEPPWGWWMAAAAAAALAHAAVLFAAVLTEFLPTVGAAGRNPIGFALMNALVPFVLVLCLCWRGSRPAPQAWLVERLADAGVLGGAMAGAGALMVVVASTFGIGPGASDAATLPRLEPLVFVASICGLIGLIVGYAVLHDVRRVALSRIADEPAARKSADASEVSPLDPDYGRLASP